MTLKEQTVQLSGDTHSIRLPKALREEVIFLAEERLSGESGDEDVKECDQNKITFECISEEGQ